MRIKKLTIQNMNSIYGAWEIDFQDAAYVNSPLFAITGKTGSGKSTILDAISFALYDQTDRIDTYEDGMVIDAFVVKVDQEYTTQHTGLDSDEQIMLHVKLLVRSITYLGTDKNFTSTFIK